MIRLGLTGFPLDHSLSPRLHMAALNALGIAGEYNLYPVRPQDNYGLMDLLQQVRTNQLKGINVTIPHKQAIIPLLDDLSTTAGGIGAVNTIYNSDSKLLGENTDALGFWTDLILQFPLLLEHHHPAAVILGAGGSARAVAYILSKQGWELLILSRRIEQANELVRSMNIQAQTGILGNNFLRDKYMKLKQLYHLIINTTPLGMYPNMQASPWPIDLPFPANVCVYDLVYNPPSTLLLETASAAGCKTSNGIGMLVEQAALALEIWLNQAVPRESMIACMSAYMNNRK